MKITVEQITPHDKEWDSLVKSVPEGTLYQTTHWAGYLEKDFQVKTFFFIAKGEKGDILASLFLYRIPSFRRLLKFGVLGNFIFKLINSLILVMRWDFGPLIYDKTNFKEILEYFLKATMKLIGKKRPVFLRKISVPIHNNKNYTTEGHNILLNLGFRQKAFATVVTNLEKEEGELWNDLEYSAKKAIKKSSALNLNVSLLKKERLNDYYKILRESRERAGVDLPPYYPNSIIWDELEGKKGILKVFSVEKEGKLLGAIGILNFNGIIFEIGPAQSNYAFKNKVYVNDILKWHIIKNGKIEGAKLYDLCGIFYSPKNEKERNLNRFKEKWGGEKVFYKYYSKFLW